ncbi:MAG: AI-2E family transporter [Ruminococcaceae bacterium]|nr:AI-2E family transporter [Oscillospiraceae bacterium]
MKSKLNQKYITISAYVLGVILFGLLFLLFASNFLKVIEFIKGIIHEVRAIIYGAIFALFFFPFLRTNEKIFTKLFCRKKDRPKLVKIFSLITIYIVFFLVVALVVTMILPPMLSTVTELRATLITSINNTRHWIETLVSDSPLLFNMYDSIAKYLSEDLFSTSESSLVSRVQSIGTKIVGEIVEIIIGLILSVYFLSSRKYISSVLGKALAAVFTPQHERKIAHFIKRFYTDFNEFISARVLCSLYISSITFLVCRLFNIPFYPLIFLIMLVLNIVPVFGPLISTLLTVVTIFITSRHHTLILLATILLTQLFENLIIDPAMLKKKLRPNVGAAIAVSLVFYALFGLLGALISIPLYATLSVELRALSAKLLSKKKLPIDTCLYIGYDLSAALGLENESVTSTDKLVGASEEKEDIDSVK